MEKPYEMNAGDALIVMSMRIYDLLSLIAETQDPEAAAELQRDHLDGIIHCSPPAFLSVEDEDDELS